MLGGQASERTGAEEAIRTIAGALLRRYGVVFKRILERESVTIPWRDLLLVYRRLEARGEVRGGRFVAGMSGEQFALPEAVAQLRAVRRAERTGRLLSLSAADPLNLVGIITPGERIPAIAPNRIVFQDGVPLAAREGGTVRPLTAYGPERAVAVERALARKRIGPALRTWLALAGREPSVPGTTGARRRNTRREVEGVR
jgi:ATP-dependent Lhr-like helicase